MKQLNLFAHKWRRKRSKVSDLRRPRSYIHSLLLILIQRSEGLCGICGGRLHSDDFVEIDHIVPVSRGGDYDIDNLQIAHRGCNSSKSNLTQQEYIQNTIEKQLYPNEKRSINDKRGKKRKPYTDDFNATGGKSHERVAFWIRFCFGVCMYCVDSYRLVR